MALFAAVHLKLRDWLWGFLSVMTSSPSCAHFESVQQYQCCVCLSGRLIASTYGSQLLTLSQACLCGCRFNNPCPPSVRTVLQVLSPSHKCSPSSRRARQGSYRKPYSTMQRLQTAAWRMKQVQIGALGIPLMPGMLSFLAAAHPQSVHKPTILAH